MLTNDVPNEYAKRINGVINFILANPDGDLSLSSLASIAGYSPFHFQRIFKQVTGESPKQYIVRIRLETAAHSLIVHTGKTITEIALDAGFSSAAVFARAFKNYFGITSEHFRRLKKEYSGGVNGEDVRETPARPGRAPKVIVLKREALSFSQDVVIKRQPGCRGLFVNAKLDDPSSIHAAFKKVAQLAETHDLLTTGSKFTGVIYVHYNLYRAFVTIDARLKIPERLDSSDIPGGKFAVIHAKGDFLQSFGTLVAFSEIWLPQSGYKLADTFYLEVFSGSLPGGEQPYETLEKDLYSPIRPV